MPSGLQGPTGNLGFCCPETLRPWDPETRLCPPHTYQPLRGQSSGSPWTQCLLLDLWAFRVFWSWEERGRVRKGLGRGLRPAKGGAGREGDPFTGGGWCSRQGPEPPLLSRAGRPPRVRWPGKEAGARPEGCAEPRPEAGCLAGSACCSDSHLYF